MYGNDFYYSLTKEQRHIYRVSREEARRYYGIYGNRNLVLHHKDETMRHNNIDRYIMWLPDDIVVISKKEHSRLHSIGESNPFYGKRHTKETLQKISEKNSGRTYSEEERRRMSENSPMKGKHHPPEVIQKMKENNARVWKDKVGDEHPCSKAVLGLDTDGNIVVRYGSSQQAVNDGHNQGHICECCRGERKKHHGLRWVWETDYNKTDEILNLFQMCR